MFIYLFFFSKYFYDFLCFGKLIKFGVWIFYLVEYMLYGSIFEMNEFFVFFL